MSHFGIVEVCLMFDLAFLAPDFCFKESSSCHGTLSKRLPLVSIAYDLPFLIFVIQLFITFLTKHIAVIIKFVEIAVLLNMIITRLQC